MLSEKKPSERILEAPGMYGGDRALSAVLDEHHVAIRALQLRDGAKAEAGEGDALEMLDAIIRDTNATEYLWKNPEIVERVEDVIAALRQERTAQLGKLRESEWHRSRTMKQLQETDVALTAEQRAHEATKAELARAQTGRVSKHAAETIAQLQRELADEKRAHEETKATERQAAINYLDGIKDYDREISEKGAIIATLTRERDSAQALQRVTQENLTSERQRREELLRQRDEARENTEHYCKRLDELTADRDRLQGELGRVKVEFNNETNRLARELRKADDERQAKLLVFDQVDQELAECRRELATVRDELGTANVRTKLFKEQRDQATEQLRAQSSDGQLMAHVEALAKMADELASSMLDNNYARAAIYSAVGDISARLRVALAAHPAPSNGHRPVGPGEESGQLLFDAGLNAAATLTIGAHTMTVAEWEALAKERGRADMLSLTNESLRARIEKAVVRVDGALRAEARGEDCEATFGDTLLAIRSALTSDQAPGEGKLNDISPTGHVMVDDPVSTPDANRWCNPCNKVERHRLFGELWRCSDCGSADSVAVKTASASSLVEQAAMVPTMGTVDDDADRAVRKALNDRMGPTHRMVRASTVTDLVERVCGRLTEVRDEPRQLGQYQAGVFDGLNAAIRIVREEAARPVSGEIPGVEWESEQGHVIAYISEGEEPNKKGKRDSVRLSVGNSAAEVPGDLYIECSEGAIEAMARLTRDQIRLTLVPLLQRFADTGALRIEAAKDGAK